MFDDFDAQDQQNSPVSFKPVATTSENPELQGYKTPAQLALEGELADRSTLAAAFRTASLDTLRLPAFAPSSLRTAATAFLRPRVSARANAARLFAQWRMAASALNGSHCLRRFPGSA